MRKTLLLLWMLFPVMIAAYHFNYGSAQIARERAQDQYLEIMRMRRQEKPDWPRIIEAYEQLTAELPPDQDPLAFRQIELAICEARIEMLDLERAIDDLTRLLQEATFVYGENAPVTRGVREQLGKAHYYATWVLKTNGVPETEWRPYAERARQLFRFLAELEDPEEFQRYEARVRQAFEVAVEGGTVDDQSLAEAN